MDARRNGDYWSDPDVSLQRINRTAPADMCSASNLLSRYIAVAKHWAPVGGVRARQSNPNAHGRAIETTSTSRLEQCLREVKYGFCG